MGFHAPVPPAAAGSCAMEGGELGAENMETLTELGDELTLGDIDGGRRGSRGGGGARGLPRRGACGVSRGLSVDLRLPGPPRGRGRGWRGSRLSLRGVSPTPAWGVGAQGGPIGIGSAAWGARPTRDGLPVRVGEGRSGESPVPSG